MKDSIKAIKVDIKLKKAEVARLERALVLLTVDNDNVGTGKQTIGGGTGVIRVPTGHTPQPPPAPENPPPVVPPSQPAGKPSPAATGPSQGEADQPKWAVKKVQGGFWVDKDNMTEAQRDVISAISVEGGLPKPAYEDLLKTDIGTAVEKRLADRGYINIILKSKIGGPSSMKVKHFTLTTLGRAKAKSIEKGENAVLKVQTV